MKFDSKIKKKPHVKRYIEQNYYEYFDFLK